MEQEMGRIPSNGIHKSEPQYYHIKESQQSQEGHF